MTAEPTRTPDGRPHRRFQSPDPRRACARTQDPGAGLGSYTCDQQVSGPRPPLASLCSAPRGGAPPPRPAPAPAREFPAFLRVMLAFRGLRERGARSRESRTLSGCSRRGGGARPGLGRQEVADLPAASWAGGLRLIFFFFFYRSRGRPAVLRVGLRLCGLSAGAPASESRFCGFSHCWVGTPAVPMGSRYGWFAVEWCLGRGSCFP